MQRRSEHRPLRPISPVTVGLLWLSVMGVSWAQREVTIQQGPLYRTVGSHITIWCQVRGYQGPSEQNFQYSIYLLSAPDREVQMVSTQDASFSYAIYSQRVRSGDIYVERVTGDHSVLHIRQLQERDTGEYECHTPNTDPKFYGSYSAKVNLSVLPDTLLVTMPQLELEKTESSSLEVTCDVFKSSPRHTHVSVSWFLTTDKEIDILSLSMDFVLIPGESFKERFRSGDIRMDKIGETIYRLSIKELQLSDQGDLFCKGSEWIQDPDGKWTKITEKSNKTTIKVTALQVGDFTVQAQSKDTRMRPKSALDITCSISGPSLVTGRFHVSWLLDGAVMATWNTSGVSSFGTQYRTREMTGQMSVRRRDQETWTLKINQATEQDGGSYLCDVTEEGSRRRRQSTAVTVTIETAGTSIRNVRLHPEVSNLYEGDSLTLSCQVSGSSGVMDVTWLTMQSLGRWVEVASLRRDGEVVVAGEYVHKHSSGQLTAQRLRDGLHSLRLDSMVEEDGGLYRCCLTEWTQRSDDEWRNETYVSNEVQISVQHLGSGLEVVLMSREQQVMSGSSARLFCIVKAPYSLQDKRLLWSWDFQPRFGSFQNLVNVSGDGGLSWEENAPRFQGAAQISIVGHTSTLKIYPIQRQHHQGAYRCRVQVLRRDASVPHTSASSIAMNVNVQLPVNTLNVCRQNMTLAVPAGADVVLRCPLEDVQGSAALYSVSWHFQAAPLLYPSLLYRVGWEGVTEYMEGLAQRLQMVAAVRGNYSLILRTVGQEDAGRYHCQVEEWRLLEGNWRLEASDTSGYLQLEVVIPDDRLRVNLTELTLVAPEESSLTLPCHVLSTSVSGSIFSITWWKVRVLGPQLLFNASHLGHFVYPSEEGNRLQYEQASELTFHLRILRTHRADTGVYYCRIQEWARTPRGVWYQIGQRSGGNMSITIQPAGFHSHICPSPGFLYFLLVVLGLFLFLLMVLGWRLLTRWRNKTRSSSTQAEKALWTSMKTSKVNFDDRSEEEPETVETEQIQLQSAKDLSQ
ncbi:immunoglobulin superfamily member 3-like [Bufo bufo]|uniref:immunoglobulin superfamily member 3-like n=1 Tax=Bufo bufo TaxID=8384 RepID=UPI001ABE4821|nr:immunoglobulin superfamily member 3-like [Bufo bufo]